MKGCICLDIDGTITADPFSLPAPVKEGFYTLYKTGWTFLFSTGRPYSFAKNTLGSLPFPYYLSVQNGADLLKMPEKKPLWKQHLTGGVIGALDELYKELEEDFLIYSGWEKGDFCYYRPHHFSFQIQNHLKVIQSLVPEPWQEVDEFSDLFSATFPLIKALGTEKEMKKLNEILLLENDLQVSCILDPLSKGKVYMNLVTSKKASKGEVLKRMRSELPEGAFFIAAGDDYNDVSMLEEADYSIVMKTAPCSMFSLADYIAEPASELGILEALFRATEGRF